ncbi:hypothetical protein [Nocardia aurantia]|uniref:hypothetical protein n=1 Tax=Nocardia aurantia TaxID=2585199 RepID=UPI0012953B56|nr:hypothetical protein [Nocardia aurantia]
MAVAVDRRGRRRVAEGSWTTRIPLRAGHSPDLILEISDRTPPDDAVALVHALPLELSVLLSADG